MLTIAGGIVLAVLFLTVGLALLAILANGAFEIAATVLAPFISVTRSIALALYPAVEFIARHGRRVQYIGLAAYSSFLLLPLYDLPMWVAFVVFGLLAAVVLTWPARNPK